MPDASADNAHRVEPTPRGEFFKVFGRLMHRTARPSVHVRRCRRHLYRVRLELRSKYRDSDILMREARQSIAECLKLLLALTGLPRVYRILDRRRRNKPRPDELDARTQEAVRVFRSRLDAASLPPISRVLLYGSRARGDHRHDNDVDIVLVFAGARPDYDKQAAVWRDVEVVQWNAYADLKKPRVEITSFAYWQEEFDEPDKQYNPDFFRNVLADGIEVTIEDQISG